MHITSQAFWMNIHPVSLSRIFTFNVFIIFYKVDWIVSHSDLFPCDNLIELEYISIGIPTVSDSVGLRKGPEKICISNKFLSNADAAISGPQFWSIFQEAKNFISILDKHSGAAGVAAPETKFWLTPVFCLWPSHLDFPSFFSLCYIWIFF